MKYPSFVGRLGLLLLMTILLGLAACSKSDLAEDSSSGSGDSSASAASGSVNIDSTYTTGSAEGSSETGSDEDDLAETSFSLSATVSIVFGSTVTVTNPLAGKGLTIRKRQQYGCQRLRWRRGL